MSLVWYVSNGVVYAGKHVVKNMESDFMVSICRQGQWEPLNQATYTCARKTTGLSLCQTAGMMIMSCSYEPYLEAF